MAHSTPLFPEEAQEKADATRVELKQAGVTHHVEITCQECPENSSCEYAFDGYNTDGDCLALK